MKINVIVPVICAILLGYLCASFIFNQYGISSFAFHETANIYFLQCGAYTTQEASQTEIKGISDKITVKEGEKYYSYIGMTADKNIAESIQKLYQENGVDIYIKDYYIENEDFVNQIKQYDILLESSDTLEEVNSVLETVLATYDETVLNS